MNLFGSAAGQNKSRHGLLLLLLVLATQLPCCLGQTAGEHMVVMDTARSLADNDNSTSYSVNASSASSPSTYDDSTSTSSYEDEKDPYEEDSYGEDAYSSSSKKEDKTKKYGEDFYYGAMSVAVLTLGLVIVVEAILHRIDMSALGKPFYTAVLDAVYRELAVLGIVELGVHIMQQYYEYDKNKKAVFADVHFLLFYTDIFNALQACVQAYFTQKVSQRLWVQTEELELDHYVEIREEYERIHQLLYGEHKTGGLFNLSRMRLKMAYRKLLVQVHFHELRVNFLEAYQLPIQLRVSDYLIRSENNVMISLVHISPAAWLWLTALCNLLYYVAGVLADWTQDAETSAHFYSICFFVGMVLFIVVSIGVDRKMRRIFLDIMKSKHLWKVDLKDNDDSDSVDSDTKHKDKQDHKDALAEEQRGLFWLGDPQLIITAVQFTQLGYAIAISTVITYYDDMRNDDYPAYWYLLSSVLCYAAFVYVTANAIPRFTLCANLGQLVDQKLLHETVSAHKLREAQRYREQRHDDEEYHDNADSFDDQNYTSLSRSISKGDFSLTLPVPAEHEEYEGSDDSPATAATMANTITPSASATDLIRMDSSATGESSSRRNSNQGGPRQRQRQQRQKAQSEGVALMQQHRPIAEESSGYNSDGGEHSPEDEQQAFLSASSSNLLSERRAGRRKSTSEGVQAMQQQQQQQERRDSLLVDLVKMDLQSVRTMWAENQNANSSVVSSSANTKSSNSREKTQSANSLIRQMRAMTGTGPTITESKKDNDDDDDVSVALSEVADLPKDHRAMTHHHHHEEHEGPKEPFSLYKMLTDYFTSPSYRLVSHVFGTMIFFFLVAMRVEGFLQKQCIVPDPDYSWDMQLKYLFPLEVVWLCVELAASLLVLLTFGCKSSDTMNRKDYKAIVAALMNVAIVSTCLGLLLGAEAQRCCEDSSDAGADQQADAYYTETDPFNADRFLQYDYGEEEVCKDATLECTCPAFGQRVYGGLGSMEPWTALIVVQAFRFIFANKLCKFFNLGVKNYHTDHHSHGHGHGHGSGVNTLEVIADAWQDAVAKHPELVAKYGEFSGELLQAMLKLDVVERRHKQGTDTMLLGVGGTAPHKNQELALTDTTPHEIDVDVNQNMVRNEPLALCNYPFEYPNAQIIRSIRRCDRMYLPLLNQWTPVDVILTKHEIVYLDLDDHDDSMSAAKTRAGSLQKLMKTKGGRGLRLNDVTAGRRVLGHLCLSDIVNVWVERELPSRAAKSVVDDDLEATSPHQVRELWESSNGNPFDSSAFVKRWEAVSQDRLRIETRRGGTLYLRFYADLLDEERHPERVAKEAGDSTLLHKDNSFNWAQTIVRICVDQLKQPLPHFGDGDIGELRDYLQSVSC